MGYFKEINRPNNINRWELSRKKDDFPTNIKNQDLKSLKSIYLLNKAISCI